MLERKIMSQQLQVLKCYSCETFQVHIVKKSTKWDCKICGEKQTIKKIYGQGSGADCRHHVQLLNELRMQNTSTTTCNVRSEVENKDDTVLNNLISTCVNTKDRLQQVKGSKWDKYLSANSDPNSSEGIESDWSIPKINCETSKTEVNTHNGNYNNVIGSQEQLNFNLFDDFGEYDIFEQDMENEVDFVMSTRESISSIKKEAVTYQKSILSSELECDALGESISSNNNEVVTYHRSLLSNVFCQHECDDGELDEILTL